MERGTLAALGIRPLDASRAPRQERGAPEPTRMGDEEDPILVPPAAHSNHAITYAEAHAGKWAERA